MIDALRKWFLDYTAGFLSGDSAADTNYLLKRHHTLRVAKNSRQIATALGMSPADIALAEAAGLVHDVGRFPQYQRFGTFNDRLSLNHATLGLEVMAAAPVWHSFPNAQRCILETAVGHHNAALIPENLDARSRCFLKLLRDADKLDILLVMVKYYQEMAAGSQNTAIVRGLPDNPGYSPKVVAALEAGCFVRSEDMQTLNDFKLMQVSWVYDLNFAESFRMVCQRHYLEKLLSVLPADETITRLVAAAKVHARSRAKHGCQK